MPDLQHASRSDSVNVEQIMEQIRARIREKRGVDYTEQQIRELAAVKLEKFLDPRGVRSDLLEQFRRRSRVQRRSCRTTRSKRTRCSSRSARRCAGSASCCIRSSSCSSIRTRSSRRCTSSRG